ncbi:g8855 [Coccomyxa elongata]
MTLGSQAVPSGSEACTQQHPCQCDDTVPSTAGQGSDTSSKRGDSSPYLSVDPAPAAPLSTPTPELRRLLLDEHAPIFKRYTALFALRNKGGREEVAALEDSLRGRSALLKHEVAYVLGQVQDSAAIDALE